MSFRQRLALRLHLMICDACTQFSRQMGLLREAIGQLGRGMENDEMIRLPEAARQRIGNSVADHARLLDAERQHSDQHTND